MKDNKKKPKSRKQKEKKPRDFESTKTILLLIALGACILMSIYSMYVINKEKDEKEIPYTEVITSINEDKVEKIKMTSGSATINVILKGEGEEEEREKIVLVPSLQAFMEMVQEKVDKEGKKIELIQEPVNPVLRISDTLFSLLPTILLVVLMVMMIKMQGLGGDSGKVYGGEDGSKSPDVRFDDIAGLDEEKGELIEIVDFLKKPKAYLDMGAKIPKGILLYGKPGTGKTLIARAIAGEAGVPFISMSGSEFIEMFAGLGASRVRKLFEKAKKMAPCIIFIDEIDAIGSRRTSNSGSETENNQTLNQLLVEMDGFDTTETIIVLAATNRPEMLDKALLRPGRFDRQVTIPAPDLIGREEILKLHSKNKKFADDVDFKSIAGDTAGFTGAELANVLNEAAIIATRLKHKEISNDDIENAVKKITVGLEKTNRVISDKDKKLTAYHEAGHAVVSKFLPTQTDVKEVSIIPRGLAGGYTMYKTNEDKYYVSRTELLEKMVALMGGRAAEKIALNEISTGASNDIEVATGIAKDMLTIYGMDDSLGPISLKVDDPYELQIFGDKVIDKVGNQIQVLIDNAYETAQRILLENMDTLDRVALTLLEKEKITSEEFEEFFK
ncbi:MAG: ATP-dependent zinc metalloprotease FtsH [Clostridia bacterium]|nr:ATP-dependent zinc metalloprotease FtsH [Clostridia bacterium]